MKSQPGGLSYFSSQCGLVCNNVIEYELVLASGEITTASNTFKPDLWRALKGGSNNFAIVTRLTFRCVPCAKVWSGFMFLPNFETPKILDAFHEFIGRADSDSQPSSTSTLDLHPDPAHSSVPPSSSSSSSFDQHAPGPIIFFSYIQAVGLTLAGVNLVHTKPIPSIHSKEWPTCWRNSGFSKLWRYWNTTRIRSITEATSEHHDLNPAGRRQLLGPTTTIKNDPATLMFVHAAWTQTTVTLRQVKNMGLTLLFQPLLPRWVKKGDPNPLGLDDLAEDDPLVVVSFDVNWHNREDDRLVRKTIRHAMDRIEDFAKTKGTDHRWRYLNYCTDWQRPFEGYGEDNWGFLKEVSRKYDPQGMFQKGCKGGFKLFVEHDEEVEGEGEGQGVGGLSLGEKGEGEADVGFKPKENGTSSEVM